LLAVASCLHAEQLPIRTYTTADGLPNNAINSIVRDSHGFLWFCTNEGLSRFDGYTFTNYAVDEGLPHPGVQDLLETRSGDYWVATADGLCRFELTPSRRRPRTDDLRAARFVVYRPPGDEHSRNIVALLEDRQSTIWRDTGRALSAGGDGEWDFFQLVDLRLPQGFGVVTALAEDGQGTLWVGTLRGLYRRLPGGSIERYGTGQGLPT
jgi:ligand-binding sensor domain-containing protein